MKCVFCTHFALWSLVWGFGSVENCTTFALPKSHIAALTAERILFAFCMVVEVETPTRLLCEPRTPKQKAFLFLKHT